MGKRKAPKTKDRLAMLEEEVERLRILVEKLRRIIFEEHGGSGDGGPAQEES